jgi:hypothetical protein
LCKRIKNVELGNVDKKLVYMNIELKSSSIEKFIECDESILTSEDLTDKEIYDLEVNNEEEVCETVESVEEIP